VDAVVRIRGDQVPEAFLVGTPAEALVGGDTAVKDFLDLTDADTPIMFGLLQASRPCGGCSRRPDALW
jgi:hypothetical protein